jgi:glycosyltransferase involved in cell wall biosynthesis
MTRTKSKRLLALVAPSQDDAIAILHACISPASFWPPDQIGPQPAWLEHAPFAFWLVEALRPRTLVELGTHGGFSYFALCEAVERCRLDTRCYAVDTWKGDEHAGFYGEDVFAAVTRHNERRYAAFSTLVRATFDQAVRDFDDGTIDLLHIDGRHFYADVKHDFETWRQKLSARAVVLFHDTNVHERGFGVFRLWEELRQAHPHFEFLHGHGLGVLSVGGELTSQVRALFAADAEASVHIRNAYSRLGSAVSLALRTRELDLRVQQQAAALAQSDAKVSALDQALSERDNELGALQQVLAERTAKAAALDQALSERNNEIGALQQALAERNAKVSSPDQALSERNNEIGALQQALAERNAKVSSLDQALSERNNEIGALQRALAELTAARNLIAHLRGALEDRELEVQSIKASTSWRLTRPMRRAGTALPRFAQFGRRVLKSLWGASTSRPGAGTKLPTRDREGTAEVRQDQSRLLQLDRLESLADPRQSVPEDREADGKLLKESGLLDADAYRAAAGIDAATNAAEHYLAAGWRQGLEPGPDFEGGFLYPYFCSAGFAGPPAMTYIKLRAAGWPVYATRAEAEPTAALIRASNLFDAAGYIGRIGSIGEMDPALHYVVVGEQMGLTPSERFDPEYYGDRYPDLAQARINRLGHYIASGYTEGRRPVGIAAPLSFDQSRLNPKRETVLLVVHEASRTGAPILAYNVAKRLRRKYNVVALLLDRGELVGNFDACCAAVVGPLTRADWHPDEMKHLVKRLLAAYRVSYAIVNSIVSGVIVPSLASAFVPVVLLMHEFASYTQPKPMMHQALDSATEIVFSAGIVAQSAQEEHPTLHRRAVHILPQGRCDLPPAPRKDVASTEPGDLRQTFRPPGSEKALVVLGCGFVHIRKGVDLFLSCAAAVAALRPKRAVRFVWIGQGYDPEKDVTYSCYLADQIARSGLEGTVAIIDAVPDLEPAYAMADFFFLSSRLDPLPNVTIDAALHGLPVICFERASGMAELLGADATTRQCVVPHLDVQAAARVIAELADDEGKRLQVADAFRRIGQATFDMDRYVSRLDALGHEAGRTMRQRAEDFATLRDDPLFDADLFLPFDATPTSRTEAIIDFLARWITVGTNAGADYFFRRPCAGFHPQFYAHAHAGRYDTTAVNPLAHFIRSSKPDGPWMHEVITPTSSPRASRSDSELRCALHAHFHYPELATDFLRRMGRNQSRCDLLLSTDDNGKARTLRKATAGYGRGKVSIRVTPNRGRDIGPFLGDFAEDIMRDYDIIGHVHGKRSVAIDAAMGERWREFLWQNLIGDLHPMMDIIIDRFAADASAGIVFPSDPHLPDWDRNRDIAEDLAGRMGIKEPLPPFFDYPNGTMFWARAVALKPLFDLKLGWSDYPEEPLPNDGTILHALERLLPFAAQHAGYRLAVTHIPGVTW